jgi:hypothetical protein
MYCQEPPSLGDFNPSKLSFSDPQRMAYGGYKIDVKYAGKPLMLQTPPMCAPFGLTVYNNKRGKSKVLELDFYHRQMLPATEDFFRTCRMLDVNVLRAIIRHRATWIPGVKRSHYNDLNLWKKYCGITRMRESKDGQQYQPRFTAKIWDSQTVIFPLLEEGELGAMSDEEEDSMEITPDTLPKKTWLVNSLVCTGLWLSKESITMGFRVDQGRVVPEPALLAQGKAVVSGTRRKARLIF